MSSVVWKSVSLTEHCEVFSGYPFKSSGFTDDPDDIALVKGENVGQGEILWGISKRWPRTDADELERFKLQPGDVVLAMDRPWVPSGLKFSRISNSDPEALLVQRVARLRAKDGLEQGLLPYIIASPQFVAYVQNIARGVGVPHISGKEIGDFTFCLPPKPIQRRITDILSAYDDLIENNRRRMALLEEAARQLYREWFVRLRFPGHEHTRITNGVPEGWEKTNASYVMNILSGGTPKTSVPDFWDGDIPFYTPKGASDHCYVLETERSITELGLNNCNSRLYPRDTVFISARGTVGKLNLAYQPMAMSQSCYALVGKGHVSQFFLYCALRESIEHLKQHAVGAVFNAIVVDTFKRIPFLMPDAKNVRLFEETVVPMLNQVGTLMQQTQKLRAARDLLLPRLMSGEIAV
jgi:type I restriction enzyme S subunit